ncbi:MAG: TlyA family RNA methyltransferase [Kiritimatiellia bacterium]
MKRERLDQLLVERGLAETREKARRLVYAGAVRADGHPALKPGHKVAADIRLEVTRPDRFVGRGGWKLLKAIEYFTLDLEDCVCLDIGAATGGFTDCLLQHGARHVMALDVGMGLIHEKLRADPRVTVLEKINARHLQPQDLPAIPDFATVDVSFISLTKIMPALNNVLRSGGRVVSLIKPQFEAGRNQVGRGGVVRDPAVHAAVIRSIRQFGEKETGWSWLGLCPSPITGPAGNVEFLALWKKP